MEVVEAVTAAVGAERTGVRISPQNTQGVCVPLQSGEAREPHC
jgi:2,4-dienoyl-CoA reductase-like NADH-dependent reductase (Old Yellow Enzyme family)